jgi:glycosyltransferase involved in cell wall biosynthesis
VTAPLGTGPVVIDLSAGVTDATDDWIADYTVGFITALERLTPDLVGRYLLPAGRHLAGDLVELVSGKLAVAGSTGSIPESARLYHTMTVADLSRPTSEIWPPEVERSGLSFSATVHEVVPLVRQPPGSGRLLVKRARARLEVLRQADALLAVTAAVAGELVELAHADPAAVRVVGAGEPWPDVAARAAAVFETLAARRRRPWRRRARVAFVSPFPPLHSGVAAYSARLVEAFAHELAAVAPDATIDCFADGPSRAGSNPAPVGDWNSHSALRLIAIERALGGYDRVVYVLGNSEFHRGALAALRHRPGTVMAHDVRMSGLLRLSGDRSAAEDGGLDGPGTLQVAEIATLADNLLVSSEAARRLAADELGPELAQRVEVLPFAMALDEVELEAVATARGGRGDGRPLVVSFGIVDPSKLPHLLLEAAAATERDFDLAFVGPVSEPLAEELALAATRLGLGGRLQVTGHVERSAYLGYLGRATLAVQLRKGFFGEASAAVGDCLAAGLPTVVSDIGWMGDLPADAVVKVDSSAEGGVEELAKALRSLLDDAPRRAALSARAAEYAAQQTFRRAAAALVSALGLGQAAADAEGIGRPVP